MARRKKGNPILGIILLGVLALIGAWDKIVASLRQYFSDNGIYFCIVIPLVVTLWMLRTRSVKKQTRKVMTDDYLAFSLKVSPHMEVLSRKRRYLITTDDYGYTDRSKWTNEKNSFLSKVNYIPLTHRSYKGINKDLQVVILDEMIDEYESGQEFNATYCDSLTPIEYEAYCAGVLKEHGWNARTTKASGDQGVDVIAELKGVTVAIQCKKYSKPIGNAAIQEVSSGLVFWGADYGVVVTNGSYTRSARQLATAQGVTLLHHEELPKLREFLGI